MSEQEPHDPLNFMRNMWGNMGFSLPGMVAPTFDLEELEKRIKDMKAVEGWLRMNLSMLQMTIQGLEMQHTTVSAVQAMSKVATEAAKSMTAEADGAAGAPQADAGQSAPEHTAFSDAAMWPWQMMQQMREQMQHTAEQMQHTAEEAAVAATEKAPAAKPKARAAAKK